MANSDRPPTFGELIDDIQKSPDPFGPSPATDLANPFGFPVPKGERAIDTSHDKFKPSPGVTYEPHSEIFNLCNREEREAYDALQAELANTKDHFLSVKDRHWTKEGDCLVLVEWVVVKPNKKYEEARNRSEDDPDSGPI